MENMDSHDHLIENSNADLGATYTLFVSLYLVVLAFFILLNSISDKDMHKEDNAISSIGETFAGKDGKLKVDLGKVGEMDFAFVVKSYLDKIDSVTKTTFQLDNVEVTREGDGIMVVIPYVALFEAESSDIDKSKLNFLDRLSDILTEDHGIGVVSMEFTVDSRSFGKNSNDYKLDVARAASVASYMFTSGVPEDRIAAGIAPSNNGNVVMRFLVTAGGLYSGK